MKEITEAEYTDSVKDKSILYEIDKITYLEEEE